MKRLTILAAFAAVLNGASTSADWPNFRGPRHDGISDERSLATTWTKPPPQVWQKQIGAGFSSFACVGERVYTCGTADQRQTLLCLNSLTGGIIWTHPFEGEYRERQGGDGTRATPTVHDGRVYILGARGTLLCLDAEKGTEVWKKQFDQLPQWGYSGSVLLEGDLAVVSVGGKNGALLGLDRKSGQEVWKSGDYAAGYATPYPFSFQGKRYIVDFAAEAAVIVEAKTGREVLSIPWKTSYQVNAAAPIFHDGYLFLGSGYDTGSGVFQLFVEGERLTAKSIWQDKVLMPKFQSAVLHEGKLYCSDQKALVCADFLTGKEHWRKNRVRNGTILLADGHLWLLTEDGRLEIAKADPMDFVPTTKVEIFSERCWTVPVIHQGRLYARDSEKAVCLDVRGPAGAP
jgi:outer membrane protein assembly factor BamB